MSAIAPFETLRHLKVVRHIHPSCACLQDMDDTADHAVIIYAGHATGICWQGRYDLCELGWHASSFRDLESHHAYRKALDESSS